MRGAGGHARTGESSAVSAQRARHLAQAVSAHLGGSGSCTILLRRPWTWENLGRSPGSFCQQSSISRCSGAGQFLGGGSRKPSSTALIT